MQARIRPSTDLLRGPVSCRQVDLLLPAGARGAGKGNQEHGIPQTELPALVNMSGDFKLSATLRGHEEDVSYFHHVPSLEGVPPFGVHPTRPIDTPPLSFS